jgi:hypothetical protein
MGRHGRLDGQGVVCPTWVTMANRMADLMAGSYTASQPSFSRLAFTLLMIGILPRGSSNHERQRLTKMNHQAKFLIHRPFVVVIRVLLVMSALVIGFAPRASADVTYIYTGNPLTVFYVYGSAQCPSSLVTGSFTVAAPLPANLQLPGPPYYLLESGTKR